jgi:RHS repeat-associated protein
MKARQDTYYGGGRIPFRTHTLVRDGWLPVPELTDNADGSTQTMECFRGGDLSGTEQGAGGVGGLIAVSIDGQYYFPCYDHNGNIMVYVSESGSVVAHYAYTPFGEVMSASGPMADAFRFRFSTKYQDAATGLYYYGYRFYDPVMMRFLNRDPIGEDGGLNLYGFVGNDPVNRWDYLGMVEGKYVLRDVPGIELNPIQAALAYAPDQLDGFEIEYIPEETCKCKKDTIRLVQALKIGWLGDPAIDTFPEVYKKHASTPGGIPLPGYTDSGGRAGNHGSLSYIDAPFDAVGDVFGGTAFYFETCALCSDETNLGCVTFSFNGKHRKISPSSGSEIKAAKPTRLWKGAEKRWQKAAGKKP